MFQQVMGSVLVILILLLIGVWARVKGLMTHETSESISRIVVDITTPALIFVAMYRQFTPDLFRQSYILPLFGALAVLAGFMIGLALLRAARLKEDERNTFLYLSAISNFSYMPLPLAYMLFGDKGIILLFLANVGGYFMLWTFGVWILTRDKLNLAGLKNLLTPPLIGLMIGFLVPLTPLKGHIPAFIINALDMLGKATVPLVMLSVGGLIAGVDFKKAFTRASMPILVLARLILIPAVMIGLVYVLKLPPQLANIVILISVMPSASSSPIIAQRFGGNPDLAATGVFFTTVASVITVPALLSLFVR
ncbi:MAG: AEC family transporter [bacterium]|nr:AEC family transporter [bacterium]